MPSLKKKNKQKKEKTRRQNWQIEQKPATLLAFLCVFSSSLFALS
jgi:hypothetical protein